MLGGVTKSVAAFMSEAETEEDVMCVVANYVLAPALNGFVAWVLRESMGQGIQRLYFLARDGYLMYQAALRYVEQYKLPIECKYLYCSRFSIRVPNYHLDMDKALNYITLGGLDVTTKRLYQRAGFNPEQRRKMYDAKILPFEKGTQIPRHSLGTIKKQLEESNVFIEELKETSRKALPLYESYLKQEGLLDEIPMALVDSGWVGSMQKELNASLLKIGKKQTLKGFYWGLYELPNETKREDYQTYFFSPEGEMRRKTGFNNCLFECIFTAPHGMTLGYDKKENQIIPVLAEFSEVRRQKITQIEEMMMTWQKLFMGYVEDVPPSAVLEHLSGKSCLSIIEKNIEAFMHRPTKREAEIFGDLEFTDDVLEDSKNKIATKMEEKDLLQNHLLGKVWLEVTGKKNHVQQSAWYEGSAVIYGKRPKHHIFHYSCYKYLMHYRKTMNWKRRYEGN